MSQERQCKKTPEAPTVRQTATVREPQPQKTESAKRAAKVFAEMFTGRVANRHYLDQGPSFIAAPTGTFAVTLRQLAPEKKERTQSHMDFRAKAAIGAATGEFKQTMV